MMTLPQLYERIGSLPSGGYLTVDTRLNKGYVYSLIHSARAVIIQQRWKIEGKIPPIYYQPFYPEYSALSQTEKTCYVKYINVPDIIALDGRASGLGFVGGNQTLCDFREVSSRSALASMMKNSLIARLRKPIVLMLGGGEMEIYYKKSIIKDMKLEAIFSDPTKVATYNVDYDSYPIDAGDISKIENYLMQGATQLIYKTPIDRVNDQRDITVPPATRL